MADLLKRLQISEQQYGVGMEDNPFHNVSPDECMNVCFGGSGGGSPPPPPPTTMTQQTSNIPEYFQPYLERLFDRAEAVTTEPFQRYEGQRLALPTEQQQAAYQGVEEMVGGYKPYIATADLLTAQAAQQSTDPAAIAARMSPYQQSVIDIQKREALRDANKLQQQIGASAVGAGAFGGSRQALAETELGRQTGQRLADIQAVGSQQAFQQAMNQLSADRAASLAAGQQFAGLGAQQQQLGLAGLGALETVGGTQQAQQQRALDIGYEDFARETTYPQQQLQEMSSVLRGFNLPVSTYTTSQTQQAPPSFGQQAAGLGLGALGIYGAGKGVGLFAGGGDVSDNPGIKKLAAKAPQVVENMGFDPQEVINAYVGGRMNYDNGGSIYNIESLLGSPTMTMDPRKQAEIIREEANKRKTKEELEREQLRERKGLDMRELFGGTRGREQLEKDKEAFREKYPIEIMNISEYPPKDFPKVEVAPREKVLEESETITDKTELPGGVTIDTETGTGTGTVTTEFTTPPEVKPEPDVPESDPYEYNKDLMNRYLAEVFKEDTGVDIGKTAAALGMIQGIGGSREDIAAAQKSAQNLAAIEMGREKARKDDMAKAITMGMSAEQFEKKFGIEKPFYEARTEAKLAEAGYLSNFGKEKAERFKMRQKFVAEALEKAPGVRQIDLKLQRIDLGEKERRDLEIKKEKIITDYVDRRMSSVFNTTSNLPEIAPSAFTSKTGVPIMLPTPGQTGTR
jgi:hypothetical protein